MYSTENYDFHLKWRNTWFSLENKIESQVSWYKHNETCSKEVVSSGVVVIQCHPLHTHMNESCHTSEWVMSHRGMSHVTHLNEECHTYEGGMSHISIKHGTESCCRYARVMSHVWMSHVCGHRSRRRSDLKFLDLQIGRFSRPLF